MAYDGEKLIAYLSKGHNVQPELEQVWTRVQQQEEEIAELKGVLAFNDEPLRRIVEEIERAKREARAEHIKGVFGPDCGIDFNSI